MTAHAPGAGSCREVFARLSEYLDEELDAGLCDSLEAHLDGCPPCRKFLESLRRTIGLVGSLEAPALDRETRRRIIADVRRLRGELGPGRSGD
jgi:anti-sigma factor RsiW